MPILETRHLIQTATPRDVDYDYEYRCAEHEHETLNVER